MKIEVTDATDAYEAFKLVRQGFLDKINDAETQLSPKNWLSACKCIEVAELGMRRNDFFQSGEDL